MQPWIEADDGAGFQMFDNPLGGARARNEDDLKDALIRFRLGLHGIAAVDDERGARLRHDGEPGRTGKSRQPFESLGRQWHVLALVFVGAGNEKRVDFGFGHQSAYSRDARSNVL